MKKTIFAILLSMLFVAGALAQTPSPTPDVAAEKARADRAEGRLKDWPNIGRYRDADLKVAAPAGNEDRVVFMGDSITDFWKLNEYFPDKPYINRGISGQTTPQMLIRFRPDVINLKPKVVVILAGTNDISSNTGLTTPDIIEGNLTSMVELAHANGINVVLASLTPISDYTKNKDGKQTIQSGRRPPEQIRALNDWIKKYCAETGVVYLDYYTATVDDKGFLKEGTSDDGLHPNANGYAIMKPLVEQAIAVALKKKQKK